MSFRKSSRKYKKKKKSENLDLPLDDIVYRQR